MLQRIQKGLTELARRPWRTQRLPPLVGMIESCEILGVDKMTLYRWTRKNSGPHGPDKTYMIEPARIRSGPVWVRSDVERFAEEIGRQRAPSVAPAKKRRSTSKTA